MCVYPPNGTFSQITGWTGHWSGKSRKYFVVLQGRGKSQGILNTKKFGPKLFGNEKCFFLFAVAFSGHNADFFFSRLFRLLDTIKNIFQYLKVCF